MLEIYAIFAAIELVKDKEIDQKQKFHQHNLNTYDYPRKNYKLW